MSIYINISGFGNTDFNGAYRYKGIVNGYPYYVKDNTFFAVYYDKMMPITNSGAYFLFQKFIIGDTSCAPVFSYKYLKRSNDIFDDTPWIGLASEESGEQGTGTIDLMSSSSSSSSSSSNSSPSSNSSSSQSSSSLSSSSSSSSSTRPPMPELIVNGNFSAPVTQWDRLGGGTVTYADNTCYIFGDYISQTISGILLGQTYTVSLNIISGTAGLYIVCFPFVDKYDFGHYVGFDSTGVKTFDIIYGDPAYQAIYFTSGDGATFTDVSVKLKA